MRIRRLLRAIAGPVKSPDPMRSAAVTATPVPGLHECPACRADMVCPMRWQPVGSERWAIHLRCGACGVEREVVASNAQVAEFDDTLDAHQRTMERELGRLDAARMQEEIDAFIDALGRDLIDPADFAG
jgi:hypothetical protein